MHELWVLLVCSGMSMGPACLLGGLVRWGWEMCSKCSVPVSVVYIPGCGGLLALSVQVDLHEMKVELYQQGKQPLRNRGVRVNGKVGVHVNGQSWKQRERCYACVCGIASIVQEGVG